MEPGAGRKAAWSRGHGAASKERRTYPYFLRLRIKPVIILHSSSKSLSKLSLVLSSINPLLSKTITIFAFSKVDRLAIFRKFANSLFEKEYYLKYSNLHRGLVQQTYITYSFQVHQRYPGVYHQSLLLSSIFSDPEIGIAFHFF